MKQKIFIIQFRKNILTSEQEKKCFLRIIPKDGFEVEFKNLFAKDGTNDIASVWSADKIIIGGSGDFCFSNKDRQRDLYSTICQTFSLVKQFIDSGKPALGICLGHQYLAFLFGAKVVENKEQSEHGTCPIFLTEAGKKDSLFKDFSDNFLAQESHNDSVSNPEKDFILLARGSCGQIESFKIKDKKVYGVQFHPEMERQDCLDRLRILNLKDGVGFLDTPQAKRVVKNFLDL